MIFKFAQQVLKNQVKSKWTRRCLFATAGSLLGLGFGLTIPLLQSQQRELQTVEERRFQDAAPKPIQTEPEREQQPPTETTTLSDGCVAPPQGGPPVNANFEPC